MALNDGYVRFEGSAYFGFDPEGDGLDAIVVIGEQTIEIRDVNDNILSIWAPGSYRHNDQEPPLRAYFSGDEWLAPQDEELRKVLDQYLEYQPKDTEDEPKPNAFVRVLIPVLIVIAIVFAGYKLVSFLSQRLLNDTIRAEFDQSVLSTLPNTSTYCSPNESQIARDFVRSTDDLPSFDVVSGAPAKMALLPSGKVLLRSDFVDELGSEQGVIAALQIARAKTNQDDPGVAVLDGVGFAEELRFLGNGTIPEASIYDAWFYASEATQYETTLLRAIETPLGDYDAIAENLEGWEDETIEAAPAAVTLSDQEWLNMISLCENES